MWVKLEQAEFRPTRNIDGFHGPWGVAPLPEGKSQVCV